MIAILGGIGVEVRIDRPLSDASDWLHFFFLYHWGVTAIVLAIISYLIATVVGIALKGRRAQAVMWFLVGASTLLLLIGIFGITLEAGFPGGILGMLVLFGVAIGAVVLGSKELKAGRSTADSNRHSTK